MASPDIEIGKLLTTPGPNMGFYSALDAFVRNKEDQKSNDITNGSMQLDQQLERVIQDEQDDLALKINQNPQEAEVLFEAYTVNNLALENIHSS